MVCEITNHGWFNTYFSNIFVHLRKYFSHVTKNSVLNNSHFTLFISYLGSILSTSWRFHSSCLSPTIHLFWLNTNHFFSVLSNKIESWLPCPWLRTHTFNVSWCLWEIDHVLLWQCCTSLNVWSRPQEQKSPASAELPTSQPLQTTFSRLSSRTMTSCQCASLHRTKRSSH